MIDDSREAENPYRSPATDSPLGADAVPRFRLLAVFAGWLVDVVLSGVVGVILAACFFTMCYAPGMTKEQFESMFVASTTVQVIGFVTGLFCTALGGYVAAWIGKTMPMEHAFATGLISLLSGAIWYVIYPGTSSIGYAIVSMLAVVPAALLGGYMRALQNRCARTLKAI